MAPRSKLARFLSSEFPQAGSTAEAVANDEWRRAGQTIPMICRLPAVTRLKIASCLTLPIGALASSAVRSSDPGQPFPGHGSGRPVRAHDPC